ncbi:MAG: APC family permease [Actinomycetota bacterium]
MGAFKRVLLGRPLASEDAEHQLLPKILALPVFASDALSSVAYATEEIIIVLVTASVTAIHLSLPLAAAVAILMMIVIASYRQTVHAYPGGGGAYIVTHENVGEIPGLIAAGALLTDYVLTVAVSIAAGAFAVASLVPSLLGHLVPVALVFVAFITMLNLRGTKESGSLFAIPTYAFVVAILTMIAVGLGRCTFGTCPTATTPSAIPEGMAPLTILLVLRAFSSGATALTGVEAIADGVPAFRGRRPSEQARNAATTLGVLGVIAITMFLGITILANRMHARPSEAKSIVAQIADAAFNGGFGFAFVQIATALILILAANTAFQDFPRLSSILARDRFMPRQFINRGDRLVFSNGILVLAGAAAVLIIIYEAQVTRLIQLYVVGVFTSFTLSQYGMLRRWRRVRGEHWQRRAVMSGIGSAVTGVVLVVVAVSKFTHGAYLVIMAVPVIVMAFKMVNRHYISVSRQLRLPQDRPTRAAGTRVVVLVSHVDEATRRAVGYARALRPMEVRAVHVGNEETGDRIRREWIEQGLTVPLDVIPNGSRDVAGPLRAYIRGLHAAENEYVTIVLPERYTGKRFGHYLQRRHTLLLRAALQWERGVVVTDFPVHTQAGSESGRGAIQPTRTVAIVLVSAVHNASLRALEYARALRPSDLRVVSFNVEPTETQRILTDWSRLVDDVPIEAVDSPYREVVRPLLRYIRQIHAFNPDAVVSIIIPEFVVSKWWHQFLHNQSALAIKAALLFEPGVSVSSVPFHLE